MRWPRRSTRCWPRCTSVSGQRRFISDAAHQLRTPLAGLKSQTELALNEASEAAGAAHAAAARARERHAQRAPRQPAADAGARRAGIGSRAGTSRASICGASRASSPPSGCRARCRHRPRLRGRRHEPDAGGAGQRAAAARGHRQPDRQRDPLTPATGASVTVRVRSLGARRADPRSRTMAPASRRPTASASSSASPARRCRAAAASGSRSSGRSPSATAAGGAGGAAPRNCGLLRLPRLAALICGWRSLGKSGVNALAVTLTPL